MESLTLRKPKATDKASIEEFKKEFFDAGEELINGGALLDTLPFEEWIALVERNTKPEQIPDDWVEASTFIVVRESDEQIVGVIDIRHTLGTEFLAEYGGHIGYAVRPTERGKGYAKEALRLAITFAGTIGIETLMIGCYSDNEASIKVIKSCGGTFVETKPYVDGKQMDMYAIKVVEESKVPHPKNSTTIRMYNFEDEDGLFTLIEREGEEWSDYWKGEGRVKYKKALESSIVYLLFCSNELCGYARCRDDSGFGIYVYDLLVDKAHRGKEYGRMLLEQACYDYPEDDVYVMSDVDPYYKKLGYKKEGSIFTVEPSSCKA